MARFQPLCITDLKKEALDYIGKVCEWEAVWMIEEGIYSGQWAMLPPTKDFWAPICDLVLIVHIYEPYKKL